MSGMSKACTALAVVAVLATAGCVTQQQFLNNKETTAIQTAVNRARFEMNCPQVSADVLSREVTQPAIQGPFMAGIQRAQFTIGVAGCGQRQTMIVICPQGGEGCFAAAPGWSRQY
jgi:hypothetical protein